MIPAVLTFLAVKDMGMIGMQIFFDCNWTRTHNHLVCKRTFNHLAKWLSVRLRNKWLWVRAQLQSLKLQISRLFRARNS